MKSMSSISRLLVYGYVFATFSLTLMAQKVERLTKGEKEFYGWQTSKTEFTTCNNAVVTIDDGQIVKTGRECPERPPINAVTYHGTIVNVVLGPDSTGANVAEIDLKTNDGVTRELFVPATVIEQVDIDLLKTQKDVSVVTYLAGRAEEVLRK